MQVKKHFEQIGDTVLLQGAEAIVRFMATISMRPKNKDKIADQIIGWYNKNDTDFSEVLGFFETDPAALPPPVAHWQESAENRRGFSRGDTMGR